MVIFHHLHPFKQVDGIYCIHGLLGFHGFDVSIYVVSLVVTNNYCFMSFQCRYQWKYGPRNDSANVVVIHDGLVTHMDILDKKKGSESPMERAVEDLGYPKTWTYWTTKNSVNMFSCWNRCGYCHIYMSSGLHTKHHVNKQGLVVHEIGQLGQSSFVGTHLPTNIIHWIEKNIHEGLLVTQIIENTKGTYWQSSKKEDVCIKTCLWASKKPQCGP